MKSRIFFPGFILVFGIFIFSFAQQARAQTPPPSNFQAVPASACSIDFSWDAATVAPDYYEIRSTSSQSFFGGLGDLIATTTNLSYTKSGLTPGTSLRYRMRAYKSPDASIWIYPPTNPVTTPQLSNIPPEPQNNLIASARDNGGLIEIGWQGQGNLISQYGGVEIQRSLWNGSYSTAVKLQKDTEFYTDNGLTAFGSIDRTKAYKYRIRNFDKDAGCSSTMYSNYTNSVVIPPAPVNLQTSYTYNPNNPPIQLTWNASEAATYYDVYRSTSTNPFIKVGQQTNTGFSENNPELNQKYNYYIIACSANGSNVGCSASSTQISISVTNVPQKFRVRIFHVGDNDADVQFSFQNTFASSVPNYDVHRKSQGIFSSSNKISSLGGSSIQDKMFEGYDMKIPLKKIYEYGVRAKFGTNSYSDFSTKTINTNIDKVLQGVAWSGYSRDNVTPVGVGWIVFNSDFTNPDGTKLPSYSPNSKFSVQIDRDGLFSGVAWASSFGSRGWGWISFNQSDLIGCPDDPLNTNISDACSAKLINGNEVRGWARFLSTKDNPSSSFSGWISLSSKTIAGAQRGAFLGPKEVALDYLSKKITRAPSSYTLSGIWKKISEASRSILKSIEIYTSNAAVSIPYGVTYNDATKSFSGEAWGGEPLVGWISFGGSSCTVCNVSVNEKNAPPVVSDVTVTEATISEAGETDRSGSVWCAKTPKYKITWKYTDPDGDPSRSTQIVFMKPNGTELFSTSLSNQIQSGSTGTYFLTDPITKLGQRETFKVGITAEDLNGAFSDQSISNATQTPKHYYALVDFTWKPNPALLNIGSTKFDGTAIDRSGGEWSVNYWKWTFPKADPLTAQTQVATTTFFATSTDPVNLTIRDSNNNSCSIDYYDVASSTRKFKRIFREL